MPISWIRKPDDDEEKEEKPREIEIKPELIKKAIEPDLEELKSGMKSMQDYITEQQKERREAREREAAEAFARQQKERNDNQNDSMRWMENPREATLEEMRPLVEAQLRTNARLARQDILSKMEYYNDPTIREKVDALIAAQPLRSQTDPAIILNAYKVTVFDHSEEIKSGKVKSQLSGASSKGTGGHKGDEDDKPNDKLSEAEKVYVKKLGIKESDYIKQRNDMEFI